MSETITLKLTVNGKSRTARCVPLKRLLDVLREDLALPGTKEGCGEGECGACSVLMNGLSVCACLVPAVQAQGADVVTVEGLAKNGRLTALQQAFIELGAAQCGICTPGMLVTSAELLRRVKGRVPGDAEVREALAGNLCRCTGYQKIVDAVREAARRQAAGTRTPRRARAATRRAKAKATRRAKAKVAPPARAKARPRRRTAAKRSSR